MDVYSSVGHLEHGCPPVVEANEVFECVLTVYKGSDMHIEAQFTGGSTVSSYMDGEILIKFYTHFFCG